VALREEKATIRLMLTLSCPARKARLGKLLQRNFLNLERPESDLEEFD